MYVRDDQMAVKRSSPRLDTNVAGEVAKNRGVKTRTEATEVSLREIDALKRFKRLMKKHAGKLSFDGYIE
jgi:hypothetical protein